MIKKDIELEWVRGGGVDNEMGRKGVGKKGCGNGKEKGGGAGTMGQI